MQMAGSAAVRDGVVAHVSNFSVASHKVGGRWLPLFDVRTSDRVYTIDGQPTLAVLADRVVRTFPAVDRPLADVRREAVGRVTAACRDRRLALIAEGDAEKLDIYAAQLRVAELASHGDALAASQMADLAAARGVTASAQIADIIDRAARADRITLRIRALEAAAKGAVTSAATVAAIAAEEASLAVDLAAVA